MSKRLLASADAGSTRTAAHLVREAFGHSQIGLVGNHVLAGEDDVGHDLQGRREVWRHFHGKGYAALRY